MPMVWTDSVDAHLFAYLLRTHKFKIDAEMLAETMRNAEHITAGAIDRRIRKFKSGRAGPALGQAKKPDSTATQTNPRSNAQTHTTGRRAGPGQTPNQKRKHSSENANEAETAGADAETTPRRGNKRRFTRSSVSSGAHASPQTQTQGQHTSAKPFPNRRGPKQENVESSDKEDMEKNKDRIRDWLDLIYSFLVKTSKDPGFIEELRNVEAVKYTRVLGCKVVYWVDFLW